MAKATAKKVVAPEPEEDTLIISVDTDNYTIGHMRLLLQLRKVSMADDKDAMLELLPDLIDMLDAVVVGGVEHIPHNRIWDVAAAVQDQLNG